jgi:LemA protein
MMLKLIVLVLFVCLVVFGCSTLVGVGVYKNLVALQESAKKQMANVENQYQRRNDLIPNLIEVVKGYASHERETLTAVIEARAKATQTKIDINDVNSLSKFQAAQGELSSALSRLMVVVEKYPELRAIEEFRKLHDDLGGTENRIAFERQKYNEEATQFNIKRRMLFAKFIVIPLIGDFTEIPVFKAEEGARKVPVVKF